MTDLQEALAIVKGESGLLVERMVERRHLVALAEDRQRLLDILDGPDRSKPPCLECGAVTLLEANDKCLCGGDKDDCHGCELWP